MRLSPAQAAKLARLAKGESLPKSQIPKSVLLQLQEGQAVRLEKSGSSYLVRGIPRKLDSFVEHRWGISDLAQFGEATPENRSRAVLTHIAGDSKALPTSPLNGVFIRSFGRCYLRDQLLSATPQGSAVLITLSELPHLRIETPYLISVENVECLWKFDKALKYFPELAGLEFALVLRWHWGTQWQRWLKQWEGQFFHFPDYDPAGLRIFVTEVLRHRKDAHLLIPKDFDAMLQHHGTRDLYLKQENLLPVDCDHIQVRRLCETLRQTRKGLEQEELLSEFSIAK